MPCGDAGEQGNRAPRQRATFPELAQGPGRHLHHPGVGVVEAGEDQRRRCLAGNGPGGGHLARPAPDPGGGVGQAGGELADGEGAHPGEGGEGGGPHAGVVVGEAVPGGGGVAAVAGERHPSAGGAVGYVARIAHDAHVSTPTPSVTAAPSKRQQRAAATADQLLAAAREVFEARGYVATTVAAITEAATTAHGTFYLYFRNKEDVFGKVMAQVADDLYREAKAPRSGDAYHTLEVATRGYLEAYSAHRGLWRCLIEGTHQSPAIAQMWLGVRRPFIERVQRNLERLLAAGRIRPMDTRLAAEALGSMVEWTSFCHVELGEPPGASPTLEELAHTLTDLWFNAVYGRQTPDSSGASG